MTQKQVKAVKARIVSINAGISALFDRLGSLSRSIEYVGFGKVKPRFGINGDGRIGLYCGCDRIDADDLIVILELRGFVTPDDFKD